MRADLYGQLVSCSASTKGHVAVAKKSGVDIFDITDDFAQIKQVKGLGSEVYANHFPFSFH